MKLKGKRSEIRTFHIGFLIAAKRNYIGSCIYIRMTYIFFFLIDLKPSVSTIYIYIFYWYFKIGKTFTCCFIFFFLFHILFQKDIQRLLAAWIFRRQKGEPCLHKELKMRISNKHNYVNLFGWCLYKLKYQFRGEKLYYA